MSHLVYITLFGETESVTLSRLGCIVLIIFSKSTTKLRSPLKFVNVFKYVDHLHNNSEREKLTLGFCYDGVVDIDKWV